MNKTEFINQIAEKADLTKKDSEKKALNAFIETVSETLKSGDDIIQLVVALVAFKLSQEQQGKDAIHKQERLYRLLLLQTYRVLKRVKL